MISPLRRLARSKASLLFPAPVGPEITITFCFSFFFSAAAEHSTVNVLRPRGTAAWKQKHALKTVLPPPEATVLAQTIILEGEFWGDIFPFYLFSNFYIKNEQNLQNKNLYELN